MIEYSIPGYNVEINTGKLNVNTHGGSLNSLNSPMVRNAIFDVASITKLYTQIIDYNLIREGYYQQDMIVSDLHPDFKNATNLSIKMLKQFNFSYNINGNIDNVNSEDKAKEILYTLKVK